MKRLAAAVSALAVLAIPPSALGWGNTGHRLVALAAMRAMPEELPMFLRTLEARTEVAELSREPDRWKGSGEIHDKDRDPGHFIDLDDQGRALGGPHIDQLPRTRMDYQKALVVAGTDEGKAGYLPYRMVDMWQQLVKDFGYWRVLAAVEARTTDPARRAWYAEDRERREQLILRDLGVFAHYVGDAAQPHHTSIHYNGWGDYPNPEGFTTERVHGPFEGEFVRANVTLPMVERALPAAATADCGRIEACVVAYLKRTNTTVVPYYRLEKAGGFRDAGVPRGAAFATERLAAGAGELRDLTLKAWRASADIKVGWPLVAVKDVEAGTADPWDALYGVD